MANLQPKHKIYQFFKIKKSSALRHRYYMYCTSIATRHQRPAVCLYLIWRREIDAASWATVCPSSLSMAVIRLDFAGEKETESVAVRLVYIARCHWLSPLQHSQTPSWTKKVLWGVGHEKGGDGKAHISVDKRWEWGLLEWPANSVPFRWYSLCQCRTMWNTIHIVYVGNSRTRKHASN